MSRTMEKRDVQIIRCDFCGDETEHVEKCVLCGKEGCNKDGGKAHTAMAVNRVYYYDVGFHGLTGKICKECVGRKIIFDGKEMTVGHFIMILSPLPCIN